MKQFLMFSLIMLALTAQAAKKPNILVFSEWLPK